jgi:hypothetical protein
MLKLIFIGLTLLCVNAQRLSFSAGYSDKESDTQSLLSDTTKSKKLVSITGTIYIKNRELRDSINGLVGQTLSKEQFELLKENIIENANYKYNLNVYLSPTGNSEDNTVQLEIEPASRVSISKIRTGNRKIYRGVNFDDGKDYAWGNSYEFDDLMFSLDEEANEADRFNIGYRLENEHMYIRSFLGLEYALEVSKENVYRFGTGVLQEGVWQVNYSNGANGSAWRMSRGELTQNLLLTPQHIAGQMPLDFSIIYFSALYSNHAFRFNYSLDNTKSALQDTLRINDSKLQNAYKFEYTMSYLDDNIYPISGAYLNAKYIINEIPEKNPNMTNLPYKVGNDYASDLLNKGSNAKTLFINSQNLINFTGNSAIQIGGQYVKQEFDVSDFDYANPKAVADLGFNTQERSMYRLNVGLRKRTGEENFLLIQYGMNHMELKGNISGTVDDKFIEARYVFTGIELKYAYIFSQKSKNNNDLADNTFNKHIHHSNGFLVSIGLALGTLY